MSSQTEQAAKASTNAVQQGGLCGIERAKGDASETARPSQAHKDQAVETYDGLTSSGKDKLDSVQKQVSEAANHFQAQASAKVDSAATQGQHDIEETKAASATYRDQAKAIAGTALGTAQDVLHRGAAMVAPAEPSAPGIVATLQTTASNALEATGGYLASAQAALTSNVPQEKKEMKQDAAEAPDNANVSTVDAATAATATARSEASQAASNARAAFQPRGDVAKQTTSNPFNSATQTVVTPSNVPSTHARDTKAAVNGHTTKAAQEYAPNAQETGATHAEAIQQEALAEKEKGALNSQQGAVTPVDLPGEGIEGVLKYGEVKSE